MAFATVSSWLLLGKARSYFRAAFFIAEVVMAGLFFLYLLKNTRQSSTEPGGVGTMPRALRDQRGVLVYFNALPERWFLPAESELRVRLPLTAISTAEDGSIYTVNMYAR